MESASALLGLNQMVQINAVWMVMFAAVNTRVLYVKTQTSAAIKISTRHVVPLETLAILNLCRWNVFQMLCTAFFK